MTRDAAARKAALETLLDYVAGDKPMEGLVKFMNHWAMRYNTVPRVLRLRASNHRELPPEWFNERMRLHGAPEGWDEE